MRFFERKHYIKFGIEHNSRIHNICIWWCFDSVSKSRMTIRSANRINRARKMQRLHTAPVYAFVAQSGCVISNVLLSRLIYHFRDFEISFSLSSRSIMSRLSHAIRNYLWLRKNGPAANLFNYLQGRSFQDLMTRTIDIKRNDFLAQTKYIYIHGKNMIYWFFKAIHNKLFYIIS